MLRITWKEEKVNPLDIQIAAVLKKMKDGGVDSEDYPALLTKLERLYELKGKPNKVSRDTLWMVGGNFAGIFLIVLFESRHGGIFSKGLNQLRSPRQN